MLPGFSPSTVAASSVLPNHAPAISVLALPASLGPTMVRRPPWSLVSSVSAVHSGMMRWCGIDSELLTSSWARVWAKPTCARLLPRKDRSPEFTTPPIAPISPASSERLERSCRYHSEKEVSPSYIRMRILSSPGVSDCSSTTLVAATAIRWLHLGQFPTASCDLARSVLV